MVSGKLYIAHTQVFVIGRDLAEQGIAPRLDFFIRANETRPTSKIVISDTTADDVLNVKPNLNTLPATNITKLVEAQVANSQSIDATLLDYINAMQSSTTSFMAPLVQIREREGEKIVAISGMAVFKEDKMVGQLSENEARGVLWVKGKVQSTVINVEILGGNASLEVLSAKGKVSPVVSGDHVTMKIDVSVSTELSEQSCAENLATEENIKKLQELVEAAICNDIATAYNKAVALNADVFGFGDTVHEHYDKEWETLQPRWDELFRSLTLEVHVDATVVSTGSLEQPVWAKEEERP
jgi:spore germination protein KC